MKVKIIVTVGFVLATTWLGMVVHSEILMVRVFIHQASQVPQTVPLSDQISAGIVRCLSRPDLFAWSKEGNVWSGAMYMSYLLTILAPVSMFLSCRMRGLRVFALAFVASNFALLAYVVRNAINPFTEFLWLSSIVVMVAAIGMYSERLRQRLLGKTIEGSHKVIHASARHPGRIDLGFTLIEVLVSITVLLVLAGIILAVYGRSKKSAYTTVEINRIKQLYLAVNLYEADYDGQSPQMLSRLTPGYVTPVSLRSDQDERNRLKLSNWPVNPWVNIEGVDPPEVAQARSDYLVSYFYLKPFEARFPKGQTYSEMRSNPEVGLLASIGLLKCGTCSGANCVGNCEYWERPGRPWTSGHPPVNMGGQIVVVRMDGSIVVRRRPDGCPGGATLGHGKLFLGGSLGCEAGPVSGP